MLAFLLSSSARPHQTAPFTSPDHPGSLQGAFQAPLQDPQHPFIQGPNQAQDFRRALPNPTANATTKIKTLKRALFKTNNGRKKIGE